MKIITLLLAFTVLSVDASVYSQNTKLSIQESEKSVRDILKIIEKQSDFRFFFNDEFTDLNKVVTIESKEKGIDEILSQLLSGSDVTFRILENNVVVITPMNKRTFQQQSVRGTITDATTGEPIVGVTIQVKGTMSGSISQADGSFSVNIPQGADVLIFSFVGYSTQEIGIEGRSVINVTMKEEVTLLDEVVVIGYGVQRKSVTTGAIASISDADLLNSSITRPEQALQGKSSGVQVVSTSGSPGSEMKVRIRGYSSNGNAEPLYIVDGVKTSSISYLSPNDIASMEVLKDAASAAIYGAEGGNGVVIINTKSGGAGVSTVNYEFQYTLQQHGKLQEVLNAEEYANYYREASIIDIPAADMDYDTDWMAEVFETAPAMRHYLSFTGGNEKTNFMLSGSILNQEGIIVMDKDKYTRYTFRMNADHKVTDWLKVGNNVSFAITRRNAVPEDSEIGSIVSSALRMDPLTPLYYEDNAIPDHVQLLLDGGKKLVKDDDDHFLGISKYISKSPNNPFVDLYNTRSGTKSNLLQGSLFAEISPVKNLTYTSRLGYEVNNSNNSSWRPTYYYNGFRYNDITSVSESYNIGSYWLWENFVAYNNKFGAHSLGVLAGMSAENRYFKNNSASGGPMLVEDENFAQLSFISGQTYSNVSGQEYTNKKASYFGRLTYDYKSKYLVMLTARRDGAGSSLLPKEGRWGFFPSASFGWVFTEESFFPESFIDFGKVRFSWGQNGSLSNLSNYMYASSISTSLLYQLADLSYQIGAVPNRLNNPELTWETSVQTDIGLDLRMFGSKLNFTVDYFYKKTTDLITPNTPPAAAGNTAPSINGGNILNKGVELDLKYNNSIGDLQYSLRGNLSFLENEVTYLDPTITRISGTWTALRCINYFEQGYPVWYFRGYKTDGINEATGELNFVELSPDGLINENDKTMIGSPIPKYTFGGGIDLSYKGFDFLVNVQGQGGNDIYQVLIRNDMPGANYPIQAYEGRWTASNPTGATMPKPGSISTQALESDLFIFKGNYARIKQMQLGYTLPVSLISKVSVKSLRVYVSLEDFFTFTKYPGMDPEAGSTYNQSIGTDRGVYPITKKALFGLSVTL